MTETRKQAASRRRYEEAREREEQEREAKGTVDAGNPDQWEPYRGADGKMHRENPETW